MSYIMVGILAVLHFTFGQPDYLLDGGWSAAVSYSFFHANIFHLAVNCFVLVQIYKSFQRRQWREIALAYIISVVVFPLSVKPVIGISNMIYAVLGMRTPPLKHPWWKSKNTIIFLVVTLAMAFIPSVSAVTHIASFALGTILALGKRYVNGINNDIKRATNSR